LGPPQAGIGHNGRRRANRVQVRSTLHLRRPWAASTGDGATSSWPNDGRKRTRRRATGWRADRVGGQSHIDPPEPAGASAGPRLVHSDPLHVSRIMSSTFANLLAKSGSPSRRHPMASHRPQLRSSNVRAQAFDSGDRPPSPQQRADAQHVPQRPDAGGQAFLCDRPITVAGPLGRKEGADGLSTGMSPPVGPRSRYARQTRPQGASRGG
jgi:hypothetical protein